MRRSHSFFSHNSLSTPPPYQTFIWTLPHAMIELQRLDAALQLQNQWYWLAWKAVTNGYQNSFGVIPCFKLHEFRCIHGVASLHTPSVWWVGSMWISTCMSNRLEAKLSLYSIFSCEHEMCELHTVAIQVFHHQTENKHKLSHLAIQTETVWLCFYFQIKSLFLFHF